MLKLYGNEHILQMLAEDGIVRKTLWTLDTVGPNAITVGLKEGITICSGKDENYADFLKKYTIYFSPVSLTDDKIGPQSVEMISFGGIALFSASARNNPILCKQLAIAVANDLVLHLNTGNTLYEIYDHFDYGFLIIDINQYNKKPYTAYYNKNFFSTLGFPQEDLYFRPAEHFFDPLPANNDFWDIIATNRIVKDYPITLSVHSKPVVCQITTEAHHQTSLMTQDIRFYITTPEKNAEKISSQISNNAVLSFDKIIGHSDAMVRLVQRAKQIALTDSNVMLLGESGTGKDIIAQAIHNYSLRKEKPFIVVNCGALPRDLIASELFGYDGGAFTGARQQGNIGKFELANGGTLFLDEIGELPLDLQATLLRAVETKRFMRVGGKQYINVDVKIICATNANLLVMVQNKSFRSDLFYRLNTMQISIPPLRERHEDIILLSEYFILKITERIGRKSLMRLSPDAINILLNYNWPGNVRELQNFIECVVQLYPDDPLLLPRHIKDNLHIQIPDGTTTMPFTPVTESADIPVGGHKKLTPMEILTALRICENNRSAAAKYLHISRKTLYRNMERLGLDRSE